VLTDTCALLVPFLRHQHAPPGYSEPTSVPVHSFAMNVVHQQENWRQRLQSEHNSAAQWRDQWGFLEHAKPGHLAIDAQMPNRHLARIIAEQGPMYDYLLKTHRENGGVIPPARFVVSGSSTQQPAHQTRANALSNSNAFTYEQHQMALQQQQHELQRARQMEALQRAYVQQPQPQHGPASTRRSVAARHGGSQSVRSLNQPHQAGGFSNSRSLQPPTHLEPLQNAPQPSAAAAASFEQASPPPRPVTPVLFLDHATARALIPAYQQDIGGCVQTNGADPHVKYRFPLTTSQRIGWNVANTTLEFFPQPARPVRTLSNRRLYGVE